MKILVVFRGAIRNSVSEILDVIRFTKNDFIKYDVECWLSTWKPTEEKYTYCNINYLYNYEENLLKEKLDIDISKYIIKPNLNLDQITRCKNNSPPLFIHSIKYIQEELYKMQNIEYTHIVLTRNDLKIKIKNLDNYINELTYVPPAYWLKSNEWLLSNDHFIILPIDKFLSIDFENIDSIINTSWNNEELNRKVFSPDKEIINEDIITYEINGTLKLKK
jgi:hypothetical protein